MRTFVITTMLLTLIACSNDNPENVNCTALTCPVVGEWEWTHTYGSIAGSTWTPDNTGMTKSLKIDDMFISFLEDGDEVDKFSYEVFESDTIFNGPDLWTFIKYDNRTRILVATDSTLEMRDGCPDCFDDYYIKKN